MKTKARTKKKPIEEKCPMVVGRCYSFKAPKHAFSGVLSKLETRRLRCDSIQDLKANPISRVTFEIQPLLRRSRFMVSGWDLDRLEQTSFYTEPLSEIAEIEPPKRFAVTPPGTLKVLLDDVGQAFALAEQTGCVVVSVVERPFDESTPQEIGDDDLFRHDHSRHD